MEQELKADSISSSSSSIQRLFSSSGLGESVLDDEGSMGKKDSILQTLVVGGGVGSNGGRICGGGGGGGGRGSDGGDGGNVSGQGFLKVIIMVVIALMLTTKIWLKQTLAMHFCLETMQNSWKR